MSSVITRFGKWAASLFYKGHFPVPPPAAKPREPPPPPRASRAMKNMGQSYLPHVFVLVVGCNTDTRTEYLHTPTAKIETELSLSQPELAPFSADGIVAAPLFRMLTPQRTQIWIKLWAQSNQMVSIRSAVLSAARTQTSQSFPNELTTRTDKPAGKGIQYGLILLGELSNDSLAAITKEGPAELSIEWKVNAATEFRPLRFVITAKTTKHWATH